MELWTLSPAGVSIKHTETLVLSEREMNKAITNLGSSGYEIVVILLFYNWSISRSSKETLYTNSGNQTDQLKWLRGASDDAEAKYERDA